MQSAFRHLSVIGLACALVACGGGGDDEENQTQASGTAANSEAPSGAKLANADHADEGNVETPVDGEATTQGLMDHIVGINPKSLAVIVRASGSVAGGIHPVMALRVNGVQVDQVTVNSVVKRDYVMVADIADGAKVELVFANDGGSNGEDRNLFVDTITLNGKLIAADAPGVVFDHGKGEAAFDGKEMMSGQKSIWWNGALRFTAGAVGETFPRSKRIGLYCYEKVYGYYTMHASFCSNRLSELGLNGDGYVLDRMASYLDNVPTEGTLPLHRYFKNGDRLYTTNFADIGLGDGGGGGWTYEGIMGHCKTAPAPDTQPLYRFTMAGRLHFFTKRKEGAIYSNAYDSEGIACHPYTKPR
jgi:hypothetical protein